MADLDVSLSAIRAWMESLPDDTVFERPLPDAEDLDYGNFCLVGQYLRAHGVPEPRVGFSVAHGIDDIIFLDDDVTELIHLFDCTVDGSEYRWTRADVLPLFAEVLHAD